MNTHNSTTLGLFLVAIAMAVGSLYAQTPEAGGPAFEVASVKPNKSGEPFGSFGSRPGGQLVVTNNTLRNMIRNAYELQEFQIVGGPDWINSDRFDIVAKGAADASPLQMLAMTKTLLADRFKLVVRRETREIPVYALVMARSDGQPGPQLRRATLDCAALLAAARQPGAPPPPRPAPGDRPVCGTRTTPGRMMTSGTAMADIARNLSPFPGRMVLDKTGLTGTFDLDLEWTPDQMPPIPPGLPAGALPLPPADGPSIFTAVQEQLGLKLDSQRGPVEVLVIDHAEQPTAD